MTNNNHPAHGPVSLDRLHQIREHLQHDTQYSNGGNRAYILADVLKVIDGVISIPATLPCPVHLEPGLKFGKGVRTQCVLDALRRRADYYAELEAMTPEQRAEHDAGIAEFKAMLGSAPATHDCQCRTCRPVTMNDVRFVVCPECGNKRCPHANDHRNSCTGSNAPGQDGSAYPEAPKEVKQ